MISEKIVIVDDDQRIHQSLKLILSEYQLVSFKDPQKALDYLLSPNEVKLVIVDVCMAGLNGIELLESLKHAKKDLAVIIVTAHGRQDIVVDALRLHADDYIEKPFDVEELRKRVKIILKEKYPVENLSSDSQNQADRMRQFIQKNYANVSLKYIAQEMGFTPLYVGSFFSQHEKGGFRVFKLKVRMEKAKDLLENSSLDVAQIAYQLGYKNPESFMRIFKKFFKKSPTAYRSQYLQKLKKT